SLIVTDCVDRPGAALSEAAFRFCSTWNTIALDVCSTGNRRFFSPGTLPRAALPGITSQYLRCSTWNIAHRVHPRELPAHRCGKHVRNSRNSLRTKEITIH